MNRIKIIWNKFRALSSERLIGFILLTPALISVLLFLLDFILLFITNSYYNRIGANILDSCVHDSAWAGWSGSDGQILHTGSSSSTFPLYIGLLALAGAYLIKRSNKD